MDVQRLRDVEARFKDAAARYEELVANAESRSRRHRWTRSLGADDPRPPWGLLPHRFRDKPPKDAHRWMELAYDDDDRIVSVVEPGVTLPSIVRVRLHTAAGADEYAFHYVVHDPEVPGTYALFSLSGFHFEDGRLSGSDRYTMHGTWEWELYTYDDAGMLCRIDSYTRLVDPDQVPGAGLSAGDVAHWVQTPEFDPSGQLKAIRTTGPGGWNGQIEWPA